MLLFTAIFGRDIPFNANIGIVDYDHDQYGISTGIVTGLNSTGFFAVKNFTDKTEALKELNTSSVRAVITIPQNFTFNLTMGIPAQTLIAVDETNPDVARLVRDGIKTFFSEYYKTLYYNQTGMNYTEPISVSEEQTVAHEPIGYKENIVPGMLTYPLLFSSMVVATGAIVFEREKGTLKKIRASPIRPINVLFRQNLGRTIPNSYINSHHVGLGCNSTCPKTELEHPVAGSNTFLGFNERNSPWPNNILHRASSTRSVKCSHDNGHCASILHRDVLPD